MMKEITEDIPQSEEFVVRCVYSDEEALMSDSDDEYNEESTSDIESSSNIDEIFNAIPEIYVNIDNNIHTTTRTLIGPNIEVEFDDTTSPDRELVELCAFQGSGLDLEVERLVESESDALIVSLGYDTVLNIVKGIAYSDRILLQDQNAQSNDYADEVDMSVLKSVHVLKEMSISLHDVPGQSIQFSIGYYRHFDLYTQTCRDPQPDAIVNSKSQVEYINQTEDPPNSLLYSTFQRAVEIMKLLDILFNEDNQQSFINLIATFDEEDYGDQIPFGESGRVADMSWLMGSSFRYIGISLKAWSIAIIKMIGDQMFAEYSNCTPPSLFASFAFYLDQENFIVMPNAWWSDGVNKSDIFISIKYIFILDCLARVNFVEEMKRSFAEYLSESIAAMSIQSKEIKQVMAILMIMEMLSKADALEEEAEVIARLLADEDVSVVDSAMTEDTVSFGQTMNFAFIDDDDNDDDRAEGETSSLEEEPETIVSLK